MERGHRQAHDQQPAAVVRGVGEQPRPGDHRVHRRDAWTDLPAGRPPAAPDPPDAAAPAADQGPEREVQGQPAGPRPRGDEALQGDGRQPHRLPGSHGDPDAHLHRAVLGHQQRVAVHPGDPRRSVGEAVWVAALPEHTPPRGPAVPRHGPRSGADESWGSDDRRGLAGLRPCGGVRDQHVRPAEDDPDALDGCAPGEHAADDAVHVPGDVRYVQPLLPPRAGRLLGLVHAHRHRDAVFRNRVGRPPPATGGGAECRVPAGPHARRRLAGEGASR